MKNKAEIIKTLKTNPIVQIACQKAGISRATYYRWRKQDQKFKKNTEIAFKKGISFINDLAESQLISLIKDKHPTSIFYWLNHRHPNYAEKRIMLSDKDQKELTANIFLQNRSDVMKFIIAKMIEGKIPKKYSAKVFSEMIKQYETNKQDDMSLTW